MLWSLVVLEAVVLAYFALCRPAVQHLWYMDSFNCSMKKRVVFPWLITKKGKIPLHILVATIELVASLHFLIFGK
jgi:hypothetical protein